MNDVIFITPNLLESVQAESVGTLLLMTILRGKGVKTDIMPFVRLGNHRDFESFLRTATEMITREQPKVVSFYTRCDDYHIMLKLAEKLKKHLDVYIVFGGPQADIVAIETLREIPYVDFICCGEGENTVYPFFSSLLRGEPDLTVPGLVYRKDGQIVKNPRPELIRDLDSLPDVDYSILPASFLSCDVKLPIDVGRGCPFGCTYCSTNTFWGRKYRLKSPQRIADEIRRLHERFGFSQFLFDHDMFTMNRKQVAETCRLLKELGFPISWHCSARLDCIDKELIDIMVDAGMQSIYLGIETGSPRMQKIINKNLKLDNLTDMLNHIASRNIRATTSFIYGFPEETEEDLSQTMALIRQIIRIPGVEFQTHLCTFLPGTELSRKYEAELAPVAFYADVAGSMAIEECAELVNNHPDLFLQFREYKTPLRTKLEHFTVFFLVWKQLQPVFQYLSEKYPGDRLIDMYYDFVEDNRKVLEETSEPGMCLNKKRVSQLIETDRFHLRFQGDENYDLISDFFRMTAIKTSGQLKANGTTTEIYCFSPKEISRCARLQDYKRSLSIVTYTRNQDGTISIRIRH